MDGILETIQTVSQIRSLSISQLNQLAEELRRFIINNVSHTGGHLSSSLGAIELTIALHYVFDTPTDKVVFDVGHQTYAHKILTGRRDEFHTLRCEGGISGFPKRSESEYDAFDTGHSSTSISAALGMARARDLKKTTESVVAVIGDGALTGGMAFEAMNDAGQSRIPFIIVLNDNGMSISKNVGAVNKYLRSMRSSDKYMTLKRRIAEFLDKTPSGSRVFKRLERMRNRIKFFLLPNVYFESIGFAYLGPVNGHDIGALITALKQAKKLNRPVVLHANTVKGKGYCFAENNAEHFHSVGKYEIETGRDVNTSGASNSELFGSTLTDIAAKTSSVVAITAAMPSGTGLSQYAKEYPERFFDVGIAEQHAVTLAAGMAASGLRPVVAVYSSFLQRAYDQVLHDVCLQNLNVVFAIDRAGLVGADGETHQGVYDVAYLSTMPNIWIYSPGSRQELAAMLNKAIVCEHPTAIRYSKAPLTDIEELDGANTDWVILKPVKSLTVVSTGRMTASAIKALDGIDIGLIHVGRLKPLDDKLVEVLSKCDRCIVIEDSLASRGFGSMLAVRMAERPVVIDCMGVIDEPVKQASISSQDKLCGIDVDGIKQHVKEMMKDG